MQKNILITGTSTGLGVSLAVQTAKAGYKVYATMRNLDKRGMLDGALAEAGVTAEVMPLDVQDMASIDTVVDHIIEEDGAIDILVNNAGAGLVRSTEQADMEDIERIIDINLTGVIRCTKAVMPHMRKARAGHVIAISSVGGIVGQPFNEIYCGAKFAVEGYIEALASYAGPAFSIDFTSIQPGGIRTEFVNNVMAQVGASGGMLEDEYLPLLQKYITTSQARGDVAYQTADEVAAVVMDVMASDTPPIRTRTSDWSNELCQLKTGLDPDGKKLQAHVIDYFMGGIDPIA